MRITCREGDGEKYSFVLNTAEKPQKASLARSFANVLEDGALSGEQILPPLGFLILKETEGDRS